MALARRAPSSTCRSPPKARREHALVGHARRAGGRTAVIAADYAGAVPSSRRRRRTDARGLSRGVRGDAVGRRHGGQVRSVLDPRKRGPAPLKAHSHSYEKRSSPFPLLCRLRENGVKTSADLALLRAEVDPATATRHARTATPPPRPVAMPRAAACGSARLPVIPQRQGRRQTVGTAALLTHNFSLLRRT